MKDRYAVLGNPIAHSKSPLIHALFAAQTGQNLVYEAIAPPLQGFAETVQRLRCEGYRGCNVTVPFKFAAFQLAAQRTARAFAAKAVNTLKFEEGLLLGDNTDGAGLVQDIVKNLGIALLDRRVLILGAGGAAYGVILPLLDAGAAICVANRTPAKALQMEADFPGKIALFSYAQLQGQSFDCVINATSCGLQGEMPPLPPALYSTGALAYDLMYGRETKFMKYSREQGAALVSDGLGMLVEQAAEAFFLWRGLRPDTAAVIAALRA